MFRTEQILANCRSYFDSSYPQDYNARVSFLVHYILPVFKYLFFVGLIGAVPVIIVTAVKTAQSMLEED
jgi:hypothetical protein